MATNSNSSEYKRTRLVIKPGDWSLWSLLGTNLFSIFYLIKSGWSFQEILWIYWAQSVSIGIINFLRILMLKNFSTDGFQINNHSVDPTPSTKYQTAVFFLFHYGIFHLVYFVFLVHPMGLAEQSLDISGIAITSGLFFINHLFSFFYNRKQDNPCPNIGTIMFYPYLRIIPMHIIIILGSILGPSVGFVLFLGLKTIADTLMHIVEHSFEAPQPAQAAKLSKISME